MQRALALGFPMIRLLQHPAACRKLSIFSKDLSFSRIEKSIKSVFANFSARLAVAS